MPSHATTIEGIILTDKGPATDSEVIAYPSYLDLQKNTNGLHSIPGQKTGLYRLELPSGKYYLAAKSTDQEKHFFSYHGLNPITIADTPQWIPFFILPVQSPKCEPGFQGIGGRVLYKELPLSRGSVTAYTFDDAPFRGIGVLTNSISNDGNFWFDLAPGSYVMIARQRQDDTSIGPLKKGDLFCYTAANPIEVHPAQACTIDLLCYPRDDLDNYVTQNFSDPRGIKQHARHEASLEKASIQGTGDHTSSSSRSMLAGRVTDLNNTPMPGLVVSAYPADDLPLFQMYILRFKSNFLAKTDAKGYFRLEVKQGTYYLVAREKVGDAPNSNEFYGLYEGNSNHSLSIKDGEAINGIQLQVEPIMP